MSAYYNEIDAYAAQWLRNLIAAGHIAPGDVDERSIVDVKPDDLAGYRQCHFFAGIGGWSLAARLAGWDDTSELWTGSCPCQPFSVAGKQAGQADERHLWPEQFRLIRARRPAVWMGEQVAAAIGKHWLDGVHSDLENIGYASRAVVVPACAVDAPHRRDRAWIVADADARQRELADETVCAGRDAPDGSSSIVADADCRHSFWWSGPLQVGRNSIAGKAETSSQRGRTQWRIKPGLPILAHGVPARVGKLRAYGNAIVPQVAAEIIAAYMDARP